MSRAVSKCCHIFHQLLCGPLDNRGSWGRGDKQNQSVVKCSALSPTIRSSSPWEKGAVSLNQVQPATSLHAHVLPYCSALTHLAPHHEHTADMPSPLGIGSGSKAPPALLQSQEEIPRDLTSHTLLFDCVTGLCVLRFREHSHMEEASRVESTFVPCLYLRH